LRIWSEENYAEYFPSSNVSRDVPPRIWDENSYGVDVRSFTRSRIQSCRCTR